MPFQKATKKQARLRMALIGPSGSGKTYTALRIATALSEKVALIDTERASASHYANVFDFDTCPLASYSVAAYIAAIKEAEQAGYGVLIIDSLSHAWAGKDGILEFVDKKAKQSQSSNTFAAWRDATPLHNQLIDTIVGSSCHIIATLRAKTEYVQEKDASGRTVIRKLGLQPVQRDGLEFEFDVVADISPDHEMIVSKTRCDTIADQTFTKNETDRASATLKAWLSDGVKPTGHTSQGAPPAAKPAPARTLEEMAGPEPIHNPAPAKPVETVATDSKYPPFIAFQSVPKVGAAVASRQQLSQWIANKEKECEAAGLAYPPLDPNADDLALANHWAQLKAILDGAGQ
jgi:hypothetical protein